MKGCPSENPCTIDCYAKRKPLHVGSEANRLMNPEALKGALAGLYKLREGDYRIIYQVLRKEHVIVIHSIGHRSEVYRKKK